MRSCRVYLLGMLFATTQAGLCYAAGCGNVTVCTKNPPNPPDPPNCVTYPNFCSALPPQLAEDLTTPQTETAIAPNYSIQLDDLSKDQLAKILDLIQLDKNKIQLPQ
jgi:hypothetical protein